MADTGNYAQIARLPRFLGDRLRQLEARLIAGSDQPERASSAGGQE